MATCEGLGCRAPSRFIVWWPLGEARSRLVEVCGRHVVTMLSTGLEFSDTVYVEDVHNPPDIDGETMEP